jgi:hypothetical protein
MKVSIVSDQHGNIVSISQFGDVGDQISGITKAGIDTEPGQSVHEIDLPKELEKVSLLDIHKSYKLDISHGSGRLSKV